MCKRLSLMDSVLSQTHTLSSARQKVAQSSLSGRDVQKWYSSPPAAIPTRNRNAAANMSGLIYSFSPMNSVILTILRLPSATRRQRMIVEKIGQLLRFILNLLGQLELQPPWQHPQKSCYPNR